MIRLSKSLHAWGTPDFEVTLKSEIAQMGGDQLPLQQGLSNCSYALDAEFEVIINRIAEEGGLIRVTAGIFYKGIVAGCGCADDPTPVEEQHEYCEVRLDIDRMTGDTTVSLSL